MSIATNSHIVVDIVDDLNTPLHVAASIGLLEFTKEIINRNPEAALCINRQGLTPLHLACACGHLAVVRELLRLRCGPELCRVPDKNGLLAIHTAAANGELGVVKEVMRDCEGWMRERTREGDSILHLAVQSENFEVIRFLVEELSDDHEILGSKDADGNTILHLAAARKQVEVI